MQISEIPRPYSLHVSEIETVFVKGLLQLEDGRLRSTIVRAVLAAAGA